MVYGYTSLVYSYFHSYRSSCAVRAGVCVACGCGRAGRGCMIVVEPCAVCVCVCGVWRVWARGVALAGEHRTLAHRALPPPGGCLAGTG